jgi:formylglycine-generating enzyme required for sulfatase activity
MTGNSQGLNAKPSRWLNNDQRPVEKVSWEDTVVFFSRLNQLEQAAGRLPTGWQYVLPYRRLSGNMPVGQVRLRFIPGGMISIPPMPIITGMVIVPLEMIPIKPVNVGQYASNSWGFFDMHGNVREWVYDWHATYSGSPQTDPTGTGIGARIGFYGVVPGTSQGRTCVLLSATPTPRAPRQRSLGFRVGFQKQ